MSAQLSPMIICNFKKKGTWKVVRNATAVCQKDASEAVQLAVRAGVILKVLQLDFLSRGAEAFVQANAVKSVV